MKDWADEEGDESEKYKYESSGIRPNLIIFHVSQPISGILNQSRLSQSDFTLPSEILVSKV